MRQLCLAHGFYELSGARDGRGCFCPARGFAAGRPETGDQWQKTTQSSLSQTVDLSPSRGPSTGLPTGRSDTAWVCAASITKQGPGTPRKPSVSQHSVVDLVKATVGAINAPGSAWTDLAANSSWCKNDHSFVPMTYVDGDLVPSMADAAGRALLSRRQPGPSEVWIRLAFLNFPGMT